MLFLGACSISKVYKKLCKVSFWLTWKYFCVCRTLKLEPYIGNLLPRASEVESEFGVSKSIFAYYYTGFV